MRESASSFFMRQTDSAPAVPPPHPGLPPSGMGEGEEEIISSGTKSACVFEVDREARFRAIDKPFYHRR
jgi:hypothetical protein